LEGLFVVGSDVEVDTIFYTTGKYVYTNIAHKKEKVMVVDGVIHSGKNTCNSGGFM